MWLVAGLTLLSGVIAAVRMDETLSSEPRHGTKSSDGTRR